MITRRTISLTLAALAVTLAAPAAFAARDRNCYEDIGCPWKQPVPLASLRKLSCQNLAHVRNHTYYENNYCFHTAAAKAAYGTVGCLYHTAASVPLNAFERTTIARIRKVEAEKDCH